MLIILPGTKVGNESIINDEFKSRKIPEDNHDQG